MKSWIWENTPFLSWDLVLVTLAMCRVSHQLAPLPHASLGLLENITFARKQALAITGEFEIDLASVKDQKHATGRPLVPSHGTQWEIRCM